MKFPKSHFALLICCAYIIILCIIGTRANQHQHHNNNNNKHTHNIDVSLDTDDALSLGVHEDVDEHNVDGVGDHDDDDDDDDDGEDDNIDIFAQTTHNNYNHNHNKNNNKHHSKHGLELAATNNNEGALDLNSNINIPNANTNNKSLENIHFQYSNIANNGQQAAVLDDFLTDKLNTATSGNTLPIFLTEPENAYVIKNRPAQIKCKASHALQVLFKCSGSSQPPPSTHDKHVDPHTGVYLDEVTATIHRDMIDEYFGKGSYKCECHAWSSRGLAKTRPALISIAYLRKQFGSSPTSLKVEKGYPAELFCKPPVGSPEPQITWYKNNAPIRITSDSSISISTSGALSFSAVNLQDMANYTCVAENVAGKRVSDSAVLIVYVNGGWSAWSQWKECKCAGKPAQGRKRTRTCSNPFPINGGAHCSGPQIQRSIDCMCAEPHELVSAGDYERSSSQRYIWSSWSEWTPCSTECLQFRHRKCVAVASDEVFTEKSLVKNNADYLRGNEEKSFCNGKDRQSAECRGDRCLIPRNDFDWTLYLGLAFVSAVCFGFGIAFVVCARRGVNTNHHYNMSHGDAEFVPTSEKKEAIDVAYDYTNLNHRCVHQIVGYSLPEHLYDVPNLNPNYTNPMDELTADYFSDNSEIALSDPSNVTYDNTEKYTKSSNSSYEHVGNNGGSLSLYDSEYVLYLPEFAIGKNIRKLITLKLLNDDNGLPYISANNYMIVCSSIIYTSPYSFNFVKPVILKVPHCLVHADMWRVSIYHAENNDEDETSSNWRKIGVVGEETINTPIFVQVEATHLYIMTEKLGRFAVTADPKHEISQQALRMKLMVFSQLNPSSVYVSLRIYIVKDFPNSLDICKQIETKLGGTHLGESGPFHFYLNSCNLSIRVRHALDDESGEHEQIIPYEHILKSSSILHCEFSIKCNTSSRHDALNFDIEFAQQQIDELESEDNVHFFTVSSHTKPCSSKDATFEHHQSIVSIDGQRSVTVPVSGVIQLPRKAKRMICAALDPPRVDERDWRLLARKLNANRYIAYFATKPSPTEALLNLWECWASNASHTIAELLSTLKEMERQDVVDAIAQTFGPMWL